MPLMCNNDPRTRTGHTKTFIGTSYCSWCFSCGNEQGESVFAAAQSWRQSAKKRTQSVLNSAIVRSCCMLLCVAAVVYVLGHVLVSRDWCTGSGCTYLGTTAWNVNCTFMLHYVLENGNRCERGTGGEDTRWGLQGIGASVTFVDIQPCKDYCHHHSSTASLWNMWKHEASRSERRFEHNGTSLPQAPHRLRVCAPHTMHLFFAARVPDCSAALAARKCSPRVRSNRIATPAAVL